MKRKQLGILAGTFILFLVLDSTHLLNSVPNWAVYILFLAVIMFMVIKHYWFETKESKRGQK